MNRSSAASAAASIAAASRWSARPACVPWVLVKNGANRTFTTTRTAVRAFGRHVRRHPTRDHGDDLARTSSQSVEVLLEGHLAAARPRGTYGVPVDPGAALAACRAGPSHGPVAGPNRGGQHVGVGGGQLVGPC